jgi:hypothetical protein
VAITISYDIQGELGGEDLSLYFPFTASDLSKLPPRVGYEEAGTLLESCHADVADFIASGELGSRHGVTWCAKSAPLGFINESLVDQPAQELFLCSTLQVQKTFDVQLEWPYYETRRMGASVNLETGELHCGYVYTVYSWEDPEGGGEGGDTVETGWRALSDEPEGDESDSAGPDEPENDEGGCAHASAASGTWLAVVMAVALRRRRR